MYKKLETVNLSTVIPTEPNIILKDFMPIAKGTITLMASAGGLGKTNIAIQLASKYGQETGKSCYVWLTEDEAGTVKARHDIMSSKGLVEKGSDKYIEYVKDFPRQLAIVEKGIFKSNYEALDNIKRSCQEDGVDLIIIDPLIAFYGGDENNNSQARTFMQPFMEWAKEGMTIVLIHHSSKGGGGIRGASAFVDAVRTLYEFDYVRDQNGNIDWESTDEGFRDVVLKKDNYNCRKHFNKTYDNGINKIRVI